jgi:polyisoprenoid-binding protein YceI
MMKGAIRISVIAAACMAEPAISHADTTTFHVRDDGTSQVTFISDAPLETMTGKSTQVAGSVTVDPTDITKTTGSFKVPVTSLRTGNDLRDKHLQGEGWLDAKSNPHIHFELTEVILGKKDSAELKKNKETKVRVHGKLTAHGITKLVATNGTVKWSDQQLHIKSNFTVNLEDHQVSVPAIVRLKVAKEIAVSVDLRAVAQ